jgi:hypothetical protein
MIVKLLLIASVIVGSLWLLRGTRRGGRLVMTRLAGLAFAVSWVIAVLAPNAVTKLANAVGVGRGADLLLYGLVVVFMFTTVSLYQHIRHLNDAVARLARAQALLQHELETARSKEVRRTP